MHSLLEKKKKENAFISFWIFFTLFILSPFTLIGPAPSEVKSCVRHWLGPLYACSIGAIHLSFLIVFSYIVFSGV